MLHAVEGRDPLLDLVVIDEAHYLRNPDTATSQLGRLLREVTEHLVLLSATPIYLKNDDLFTLLNLVDRSYLASSLSLSVKACALVNCRCEECRPAATGK